MRLLIIFFYTFVFFTASAQSHKSNLLYQLDKVKIYSLLENKNEFSNAALFLDTLILKHDSSEMLVSFRFNNFVLGAQTMRDSNNLCANSGEGQHIHFIHDKDPYTAMYSGIQKYKASKGHHVFLAFLSRSYHLSLKHPKAYVLHEYNVGEGVDDFDESKPHLFYSRPKGTYVNKDTAEVMIDFYLVNCDLSEKGYQVKVNIDEKYMMKTDQWTPLIVKGLNTGEHTLELTLIDKKGRPINNNYNKGKRKFILANNPK